jgi:hypothetical protein
MGVSPEGNGSVEDKEDYEKGGYNGVGDYFRGFFGV